MDQLVREGKLTQFLHHFNDLQGQANLEPRRDTSSRPHLVTINVIFTALGRTGSCPSRVMSVAWLFAEDTNSDSKNVRVDIQSALIFSNEDKIRTIQPHDDAWWSHSGLGGMT